MRRRNVNERHTVVTLRPKTGCTLSDHVNDRRRHRLLPLTSGIQSLLVSISSNFLSGLSNEKLIMVNNVFTCTALVISRLGTYHVARSDGKVVCFSIGDPLMRYNVLPRATQPLLTAGVNSWHDCFDCGVFLNFEFCGIGVSLKGGGTARLNFQGLFLRFKIAFCKPRQCSIVT